MRGYVPVPAANADGSLAPPGAHFCGAGFGFGLHPGALLGELALRFFALPVLRLDAGFRLGFLLGALVFPLGAGLGLGLQPGAVLGELALLFGASPGLGFLFGTLLGKLALLFGAGLGLGLEPGTLLGQLAFLFFD